ncbi:WD-repeat protein, putative [Pediculus humanus corporis]|uniref:U5 small nuclear ribonucleoprotein 40 kDa protein n=1 Tax=Pediculus humanus subsp. corporis TaxID=121224 RepID=E0VDW2_PEDHC|nr:WD-repeat protein, putative [Pediculus humanus corporis]EEB11568.1 WD-repeat protein, putative [Pediculus humanus corporis]
MTKRKSTTDELGLALINKKPKNDVALISSREKTVIPAGVDRTSSLMSPIMLMEGHLGEIFTVGFHPEGQYLASAGFDRQIFLWNVYGECENISLMLGHSGAIMELHFSTDGNSIFTASTDQTVGIWDIESGTRIKRLKGHTSFVNSCQSARRGPTQIVSGSDDCSIKVWDPRKKGQCVTLNNIYQVTSVTFNDTAEQVISGGIDNDLKVWDLRKNSILYELKGHTDTITGISLSPDGSYILSNAMDNSLRIWDVRAFAPQERCVKIFTGHQHNFEKNLLRCCWSPDGSKISAGSADRFVYIWDTTSRRILYKLPGHNGSVNDVKFHPKEPIILSCSSDKQLYMGEIEA